MFSLFSVIIYRLPRSAAEEVLQWAKPRKAAGFIFAATDRLHLSETGSSLTFESTFEARSEVRVSSSGRTPVSLLHLPIAWPMLKFSLHQLPFIPKRNPPLPVISEDRSTGLASSSIDPIFDYELPPRPLSAFATISFREASHLSSAMAEMCNCMFHMGYGCSELCQCECVPARSVGRHSVLEAERITVERRIAMQPVFMTRPIVTMEPVTVMRPVVNMQPVMGVRPVSTTVYTRTRLRQSYESYAYY